MSDFSRPARPADAFDQFLISAAPTSDAQRRWTPDDGALPALYLGHGAPPLFDDSLWIRELFDWASSLPETHRHPGCQRALGVSSVEPVRSGSQHPAGL